MGEQTAPAARRRKVFVAGCISVAQPSASHRQPRRALGVRRPSVESCPAPSGLCYWLEAALACQFCALIGGECVLLLRWAGYRAALLQRWYQGVVWG